jgi:ABC-type transporter Mla MlaB component
MGGNAGGVDLGNLGLVAGDDGEGLAVRGGEDGVGTVFAAAFEHHGRPTRVEIDMTDAHLWDLTGVAAVDKVVFRYRRQGAQVDLIGMNEAGRTLIDKLGRHDKSHLPVGAAH